MTRALIIRRATLRVSESSVRQVDPIDQEFISASPVGTSRLAAAMAKAPTTVLGPLPGQPLWWLIVHSTAMCFVGIHIFFGL